MHTKAKANCVDKLQTNQAKSYTVEYIPSIYHHLHDQFDTRKRVTKLIHRHLKDLRLLLFHLWFSIQLFKGYLTFIFVYNEAYLLARHLIAMYSVWSCSSML